MITLNHANRTSPDFKPRSKSVLVEVEIISTNGAVVVETTRSVGKNTALFATPVYEHYRHENFTRTSARRLIEVLSEYRFTKSVYFDVDFLKVTWEA